jgi:hypothetical protein
MRKDMMKVVAEPARGGSSYRIAKGENVRLQREGIDSVQHEGIGRRWNFDDRRPSRDHLNALRRFLQKQVGRRWDEVYSDICQYAPKGSFLGYHLRQLVSYEVSVNVTADGDALRGRYGWTVSKGDLFVCPETNILKIYGDGTPAKRYRWREKSEFEMLAVDEGHKYVKIDDIWYLVTLSAVPGAEVAERPFDVVLKQSAFAESFEGPRAHRHHNRFLQVWGGPFYASVKLQANSREIRQILAALAEGKKVLSKPARANNEQRFVRRPSVTGRR